MGGRSHEQAVDLRRDNPNISWGFSLVGGADVNTPLIVTRVGFGSPADGYLQRGDIISKVGNYDSRDIRHQDAQTLFKNAGNNIRIVVQRENAGRPTSTGSSRSSSRNYNSPLSVSPHLSPRGYLPTTQFSPAGSALIPTYTTPFESIDNNYFEVTDITGRHRVKRENQDIHVVNQPYRTTPLVLPGAKVKREQGGTESYLRHHPNPAVRAPPHHLDAEAFLKQKVVHKQFNSPIGLYSDANIADTVHKQTGATTVRKPAPKFDPAKSEALRALQEDAFGDHYHEINVPPQSKVYAPNKAVPGKKPLTPQPQQPQQQHQQQNDLNSMGVPNETIQQSHSFKRLMWSVMSESNY